MSEKWDSICEFRLAMSRNYGGCQELEMNYNGKEYFFTTSKKNRRVEYIIAGRHSIEPYEPPVERYDSLDEMLDGHIEDGKPLRDFILDMEIDAVCGRGVYFPPTGMHKKLQSLDELYNQMVEEELELYLTRSGKDYFITHYFKKDREVFTVAANRNNENRIEFNSFDEMLDGYKEGGIALRDFILDMYIEYDYSKDDYDQPGVH